jgi:hypothetical protein
VAFTDLQEGLAEIFGQWDVRGQYEQSLYDYARVMEARDKERKASPTYRAARRGYMKEYAQRDGVRERYRVYQREYQKRPDVAEKRRQLYGEKKRERERRRRLDPVVGERIREMERKRKRKKKAKTA